MSDSRQNGVSGRAVPPVGKPPQMYTTKNTHDVQPRPKPVPPKNQARK